MTFSRLEVFPVENEEGLCEKMIRSNLNLQQLGIIVQVIRTGEGYDSERLAQIVEMAGCRALIQQPKHLSMGIA